MIALRMHVFFVRNNHEYTIKLENFTDRFNIN